MTLTEEIKDDINVRYFLMNNQKILVSKIKDSESNIEEIVIKKMRSDYTGFKGILQFWADLLEEDFYFKDIMEHKKIEMNEPLTFKKIILTDWIPRIPGLFYHLIMWEKSEIIDESKQRRFIKQFNYADVRLGSIEGKNREFKIFNLVKNEKFIAHGDISRGIPILIPIEFFQNTTYNDTIDVIGKVLNRKGAIKIKKIKCIVRNLYDYNIEIIKKMDINRPIINKKKTFLKGAILIVQNAEDIEIEEDLPDCPILGNAWTYYLSDDKKPIFLNYLFWIGVEGYHDSINEACTKIKERMPKTKHVLFEIDAVDEIFSTISKKGETYGPTDIYLKDIIDFKVWNYKNIEIFILICSAFVTFEILLAWFSGNAYIVAISASILSIISLIGGKYLEFKKEEHEKIRY